MLNNYMDQSSLNPVDIRLLYGLTSKTPTSDKQEDIILTRHRLRKELFAEEQIIKAE